MDIPTLDCLWAYVLAKTKNKIQEFDSMWCLLLADLVVCQTPAKPDSSLWDVLGIEGTAKGERGQISEVYNISLRNAGTMVEQSETGSGVLCCKATLKDTEYVSIEHGR